MGLPGLVVCEGETEAATVAGALGYPFVATTGSEWPQGAFLEEIAGGEALPNPDERAGVLLGAVKAALVAPPDAPKPKGFPNPPRRCGNPFIGRPPDRPGRQATGRKPAGGWNATIPSGHPPGMGRESPSERRRGCGNMVLLQHRGLRTRRRCRSPTPPKGGSGTASGAGRAVATSMPTPGCGT